MGTSPSLPTTPPQGAAGREKGCREEFQRRPRSWPRQKRVACGMPWRFVMSGALAHGEARPLLGHSLRGWTTVHMGDPAQETARAGAAGSAHAARIALRAWDWLYSFPSCAACAHRPTAAAPIGDPKAAWLACARAGYRRSCMQLGGRRPVHNTPSLARVRRAAKRRHAHRHAHPIRRSHSVLMRRVGGVSFRRL